MCYPKPGPRCSAHAALKVVEAQKAFFLAREQGLASFKDAEVLLNKITEAREEYNLTPAGLQAIEDELSQNPDDARLKHQLEHYRTLRAKKIETLTEKQRKERVHKTSQQLDEYAQSALSENGEVLLHKPISDPDIQTMVQQSLDWSQKLSKEEIVTLRSYSQAAYADVNGMLSNPDYNEPGFSLEKTERMVQLMDSALAKADVEKDVVVYRRHFFYEDGNMKFINIDEQRKHFPVGSTFKPGFYMSTSLNADNAPMDSNGVAFLEIKSKRAVPLAIVASQSLNEQEFLLRRDATFKVVSNTKTVTIKDSNNLLRTVHVIQLEEI